MSDSSLRVLAISGSLRAASFNRQVLRQAKDIAAAAGATVAEADLKILSLPLYDEDIETSGLPESVRTLKAMVDRADVLLIASPEYNHSISGALKNALDWLSRGSNTLDGKTAAIFGVSAGAFGTVRGQRHLREILAALNVSSLPQPQVFIGPAAQAFDVNGNLTDERVRARLEMLVKKTLALATCFKQNL